VHVLGSPIAAWPGRLRLVAVLVFSLPALVLPGASSAASTWAKGVDVSNWNGSINWTKVAAAGYGFAFGKATEGTTFIDSTYTTNRNGSEAAGLAFGAYHFARPSGGSIAAATASGIAQADYFLATAGPQPGELPPVLDLEKTGNLGSTLLLAWTKAWVGEVDARLGVQPFVYTSPAFWQSNLANSTAVAATGAHLWIAHWTSASAPWVPAQNWDGAGWTFWQWTDCVSVPGFAHCSDGDRMNGASPASVAIAPYASGLPVLSTPPIIVGPPEAGQLLAAQPGTWQGGKPLTFSYQWEQCDAAGAHCVPIAGATGEKYRPVTADVGHSLKVVAAATSAAGSTDAPSVATVAVSPAGTKPSARPTNLSAPQIIGTAQVGQVLTSSVGTWSGSPTKFAYRWQRCDAMGGSCIAITKATHSSYTATPDDIGSTLALVVTATGPGGAASAPASTTDVVVAAPLPPVSIGSQTVAQGVAGNVQTEDGRATVTWQPGSVPVGLTVNLGTFTGTVTVPGSEVELDVPGLPAKGFRWPLDLAYAQAVPGHTVLGYSTSGPVFQVVPRLESATLPAGGTVGSYLAPNALTHVLTRAPLRLALFPQGGWGDPTYTSPDGPALAERSPLQVLAHPAAHSVFVITRLSAQSQTQLTATVTHGGRPVAVLGNGSRLGAPLPAGKAFRVVQVERDRPGTILVRLHLNGRSLKPGTYALRIAAVDPWGRRSALTLRFRYP
jgi:GH25 family lysozyme M1 (1,4-beta-N-acetylmuramidase)